MKLILGIILFLSQGCGSKAIRYEPLATSGKPRPAIVFLPGFYGTALADTETGERFFLTAWGATFGKTPLALTEPDLGVTGARPMREDGVLAHVRIIPGIYSANVYGSAIKFLTDKFGDEAEIVPFPYDWRQDISESAKRLDAVVSDLKARGTPRVLVVAHSMGGLLAAHYLSRADLVSRKSVAAVVIAGTPFSGAVTAFRNLQLGTSLGSSTVPLSYESMGTFPSMYQLLPPPESGAYLSSSGAALGADVLSPEVWKNSHFGLFKARADLAPQIQARRAAFVAKSLERARSFSRSLSSVEKGGPSPAMLYFVGTGVPTFSRVKWSQKSLNEKGHWIYDDKANYEDGDGTVSTKSATPSPGLAQARPGKVIQVKARHEEMFESDELLAATEKFLRAALH